MNPENMTPDQLIGKTAKIIGYSVDGWVNPTNPTDKGFVAHICLEVDGKRVFFLAQKETDKWDMEIEP